MYPQQSAPCGNTHAKFEVSVRLVEPAILRRGVAGAKQYKVSAITKAALTKYPALAAWGQPLRTVTYGRAGLMWIEGNVMPFTMPELKREHQIPSLSVHDSLIVPARGAETARAVLIGKFQDQRRVTPLLKIN